MHKTWSTAPPLNSQNNGFCLDSWTYVKSAKPVRGLASVDRAMQGCAPVDDGIVAAKGGIPETETDGARRPKRRVHLSTATETQA